MKLPSLSNLVIPPWVRVVLKLAPYIALALTASALQITRGTLHTARVEHALQLSEINLQSKTQELEWTRQQSDARGTYLQTLQNLSTLKDKSDEDTKTFAATPAGAVDCLSLDRVRAALQHRSDLEAALTPEGGAGEMPTGSDPTPQPLSK